MNQKGKIENSNIEKEKDDIIDYKNFPFNKMLILYVDYRVTQMKKDATTGKERNYFKSEIYDDLEKKTGIEYETIRNYYNGKSTLPKSKLDRYKKFAKIFNCSVIDIIPENLGVNKPRLILAKKIGIDEESYNILRFKRFPNLFKEGEYVETTYHKIINYLIHQKSFLNTFEKEIDDKIGELLRLKNYNDHTQKMSYKEFVQYIQEFEDNGQLNMGDKPIPSFNEAKDNIVRAFRGALNVFIANLFEDDKGE